MANVSDDFLAEKVADSTTNGPQTFTRSDVVLINSDSPREPYLSFTIGPRPLQRLVVKIWSHDQGSCNAEYETGDPNANSHTWFALGIIPEDPGLRSDAVIDEPYLCEIQRNVRASTGTRCHTREWTLNMPFEGDDDEAQGWLESISGAEGVEVGIFPFARSTGWVNVVHKVSVELYDDATAAQLPSLRMPDEGEASATSAEKAVSKTVNSYKRTGSMDGLETESEGARPGDSPAASPLSSNMMDSEPVVMLDDTGEGSAPLVREDLVRMHELASYSVSRRDAELWAENDVKFLIYDDTSVLTNGFDSDEDDDVLLKRAMRMSMEADMDGTCETTDPTAGQEPPSTSSKDNTCSCLALPLFPERFHPKKLRLYRPKKPLRSCVHYVAVSYCWPAASTDGSLLKGHQYEVRDLDGKVRPARAPASVLRRAIDVAISCGFRMIWIDQECLPQPSNDSPQEEKDEQQKGIQAMDILYSRAAITAGLLSDAYVTQQQMDAITAIRSEEITPPRNGALLSIQETDIDENTMNLAMDVFSSIISDRWYTRAWIAQEALSAGKSLVMVLSQDQGMPKQSPFTLARPLSVTSTLRIKWQSASSDIFVMPITTMHEILSAASRLMMSSLVPRPGRPSGNLRTLGRLTSIQSRVNELGAHSWNTSASEQMRWLVGDIGDAKSRRVLNCASAIHMLRSRQCRDVQDRVAIVANLCNYQFRLNTLIMARRCKSLKLALLTLALANGDLSLLVPDVYQIENEIKLAEQPDGWLWPYGDATHQIDHRQNQFAGLAIPSLNGHFETFSSSGTGICISANLWEVRDKFDMTPVQQMWSQKWERITRLQIHILPKSIGENRGLIGGYATMNIMSRRDAMMLESGMAGGHLVKLPGDWPYGTRVPRGFEALDSDARRNLADLIFAVIRHMYGLSKEPESGYALGLANSIWHSVRSTASPECVGDWIYHDEGLDQDPYGMLSIEFGRDGNADALWFLERIMRDGFLWVGRYMTAPAPDDVCARIDRLQIPSSFPFTQLLDSTHPIGHRQIIRNKMARTGSTLLESLNLTRGGNAANAEHSEKGDGQVISLMEIGCYQDWSGEKEAERGRYSAALFDVDGPCRVAIPFDGSREVLPRPYARTKRVCWVVKKMPSAPDQGRMDEQARDSYCVVNKVKGLFEWMSIPRGRYTFAY